MRTKDTGRFCDKMVMVDRGTSIQCGGKILEVTSEENGEEVTDEVCGRFKSHKNHRISKKIFIRSPEGFVGAHIF